jgi:opacity protein-like surface antigen
MKSSKLVLTAAFICGIGIHFAALADDAYALTSNGLYVDADNSIYNGFYVGINGGAAQTNTKISVNASAMYDINGIPDNIEGLSQGAKITRIEGGGSLYLGYGQLIPCSNFYLGGEIFGNFYSRPTAINNLSFQAIPLALESTTLTTQTTAKLNSGEVGIDLRPGFLLEPITLVYARVGVAFNQLKLTSNANFSATDTFDHVTIVSPLNESATENTVGVRLGFGIESHICKNTALTADYVYATYGSVNTGSQANIATPVVGGGTDTVINGLSNYTSANINTQTVAVGIKHYFG